MLLQPVLYDVSKVLKTLVVNCKSYLYSLANKRTCFKIIISETTVINRTSKFCTQNTIKSNMVVLIYCIWWRGYSFTVILVSRLGYCCCLGSQFVWSAIWTDITWRVRLYIFQIENKQISKCLFIYIQLTGCEQNKH